MSKQYFTRIYTSNMDDKTAQREHSEKLENYLKYGWAGTNEQLIQDRFGGDSAARATYQPAYEIEVHHMNTTSWMRGNMVALLTILCCSDEPIAEEKKEGEYVS